MGKYTALIGTENTARNGSVYVEAHNGVVSVIGPFEGWMGFATLADFDDADEGEALARRIAANPATELAALGYDTAGWFDPAA